MKVSSTRRLIPWERRRHILRRAGYRCQGLLVGKDGKFTRCDRCRDDGWVLEIDHIVPIEDGGGDEDANLQVLCVRCHDNKHKWRFKFRPIRRVDGLKRKGQLQKQARRMLSGREVPDPQATDYPHEVGDD